jgi:SAM-dependent methyltransferase
MTFFCKLCDSIGLKKKLSEYKINLPSFEHSEFKKISKKQILLRCKSCNLISLKNYSKVDKITKNFDLIRYSKTNQGKQKKIGGSNKKFISRNDHQAIFIKKVLKIKFKKVLDIGCFDGGLLRLLKKNARIKTFGLERNKFLRPRIKKNGAKAINSLSDINEKLDLVIFSHSIFYLKNFIEIIRKIINILDDNGTILIQIPDFRKNNLNLLLGDQYYFFSTESIQNIANIFNLKVIITNSNYIKNELIFILKKRKKDTFIKMTKDLFFSKILKKLNSKKKILKKTLDKNKFFVLGRTIDAAFIDELHKKKILGFVDTIEKKCGLTFRNKPVNTKIINTKNYSLLIPLKKISANNLEILRRKFKKLIKIRYH